jgi:diamine N-acetyltransferase
MKNQLEIVTWETVEEMEQGWPVIQQMYSDLSLDEYLRRLTNAVTLNYRQFACMDFAKKQCLGVVGLWFFPRVWCGLQADIDNFVVDKNARSQGVGKKLIDQCLDCAKQNRATLATLDTFVDNKDSHRFYFREGFTIWGYHFVKELQS